MKNILFIFLFLCILFSIKAQNSEKLYVKHFTKKNKVILRLVPKTKNFYSEITDKSIRVVRYENIKGVLSNSVIIKQIFRSYYSADTANWLPLFRKNKTRTAYLYSVLYPSATDGKMSDAEKNKFDKMMFEFMLLSCNFDKEIAKAAGLYINDSTIDNSKKYTYKLAIYTNSTSANTMPLHAIDVDASQLSVNSKISNLNGNVKGKTCILNWKASNYINEYYGYNIYRSSDSISFLKVNGAPIVLLKTQFESTKEYIYYTDTIHDANKRFYYHIKGINLFGEESDPSNILSVISMAEVKSFPVIDSLIVLQNKAVKLKWRMENNNETGLPKKYILQKSAKDQGGFKTIFESAKTLDHLDKELGLTNYYRVGAILTNNDTLFSYTRYATIIDTIPPAIPIGFKATVDKAGIVTLTWNKNKEQDLQGYKLFRSNKPTDEFVQMNEKFITDTLSTDKLNLRTLSKKIYYKIAASDNNFNTSTLSNYIEVKRPDTIPPQPPILVSVHQQTNGLVVNYILSKSYDVTKQVLLRRTELEKEFTEQINFSKKDSIGMIIDSLINQGQIYVYKLTATDEDGNTSYSRELEFLFETGFRKRISNISFTVSRTGKKIDLSWTYDQNNIEKYIIYRSKKDEKPTIIKTLNANSTQFTDRTVNMGNIYEYRIKAAMQNGTESIISLPVIVEY